MDERGTAYHEAGHAVVGYRQGFYILKISIIADEEKGRLGVTQGEGAWGCGSVDGQHVVNLYAGYQAEKRFNPDADPEGSLGDNEEAAHYVQLHGFDEAELRKRADELLDKHWAEVEAIATLLLEEKEVDWEDAEMVMEAIEEGKDWREELADFRRRRPDRR